MSVPNIPQLSAANLIMKSSALPILPAGIGSLNAVSTGNTGNNSNAGNTGEVDLTGAATPDQLLYDAFTASLSSGGSSGGGSQTSPNDALRPEDLAYAQSLYSSNPLQAYQSVSQYLTLSNFLPGAGQGTTPTGQDPTSFNGYKANYLGNISPQNAVDLANYLAGPILQQHQS